MPKMTKEQFILNIKKIYGERYSLISDFKSTQDKITIKCNICNKEYTLVANEFTRNRDKNRNRFINGCDYCRLINNSNFIKKRVSEITNNRIKVIDNNEISTVNQNIKMECTICGYKFISNIHVLESNIKKAKKETSFGCANCSKKRKKTTENFREEVYKLTNGEYVVIGEYKSTSTKIEMCHITCNKNYLVRPSDFIFKNNRCPYCFNRNISNATKFINDYLIKNNILYKAEKTFNDCKNYKLLPFDFHLPEYNLLIEYDGRQHFVDIYGKKYLKKQHKRDLIKNQYCKDNKINLIRINYLISIEKIKIILDKLFNDNLTFEDYNHYNLLVIDIEDDLIYNENKYYEHLK